MSVDDRKPMLEGVRVVDLTTVVFGPYATRILADMGAEVIKIETAQGDSFRYSGKSSKTKGMSPGHIALNRDKRSVVLDLKNDDDRMLMRNMLSQADVFIHNVRAKAIARLGLDYETVMTIKPDIVYAHCTGFGSNGPYAELQAYDDVIQAASGTATLLSRVDGDPRPRYLPSLIADKVAGLHAAYAVLGALIHRLRCGEGQHIEIPMFEAFSSFMLTEHLAGQTFVPPTGPICYARQIDPDRQPFPTANGHISIVPYTDDSWERVFSVLGDADFLRGESFATPKARVLNLAGLYRRMAELTPARTSEEWVAAFAAVAIPAMAVRDIGAIRDDPHLSAVGFFALKDHPTEGAHFEMKHPIRYSNYSQQSSSPAPRIGEHTNLVRSEFE